MTEGLDAGKQRMTPSEAFVEMLVAQGVTDVFGIVGSAYMDALDLFPAAGIRFVSIVHEQGAGAHGRRLLAASPGATASASGRTARASPTSSPRSRPPTGRTRPVVAITPETGSLTHGPRRLPGDRAAADLLEDHEVPGARDAPARMAELTAPRLRPRACSSSGRRSSTSRATTSTARSSARSRTRSASRAAPGASAASTRRRSCWPSARFPVILAGGGVVMADGVGAVRRAGRAARRAGRQQLPAQRLLPRQPPARVRPARLPRLEGGDALDRARRTSCSRSARGSGPFGTLPQYGIEYWPADAKLVQIDADPRVLGLVKKTVRRRLRRRARGGRGAPHAARRPGARLRREPGPSARGAPGGERSAGSRSSRAGITRPTAGASRS